MTPFDGRNSQLIPRRVATRSSIVASGIFSLFLNSTFKAFSTRGVVWMLAVPPVDVREAGNGPPSDGTGPRIPAGVGAPLRGVAFNAC